jgi:hypothetical protein
MQPDDLVPLCKCFVFIDCEKNRFLKKLIMMIILNLHSGAKLSGWLRHCNRGVFSCFVRIRAELNDAKCGSMSKCMVLQALFDRKI